jgi:hypothetical protein
MGNGKPQRKANQTRLNSPILPTVEMGSSGRNHLQVHESYGASPNQRRALVAHWKGQMHSFDLQCCVSWSGGRSVIQVSVPWWTWISGQG